MSSSLVLTHQLRTMALDNTGRISQCWLWDESISNSYVKLYKLEQHNLMVFFYTWQGTHFFYSSELNKKLCDEYMISYMEEDFKDRSESQSRKKWHISMDIIVTTTTICRFYRISVFYEEWMVRWTTVWIKLPLKWICAVCHKSVAWGAVAFAKIIKIIMNVIPVEWLWFDSLLKWKFMSNNSLFCTFDRSRLFF